MLGLFGIVVSLILLMYLAYRGLVSLFWRLYLHCLQSFGVE